MQNLSSLYAEPNWMHAAPARATISADERTSLNALIAYVAFGSGEREFGIERRLADRFNVPNLHFLPASAYDSAIRYLVDGMRLAA